MNNIKIPLIAGIIIFFLVLLINIFSGNILSIILLRSFISLVVSFGLFYGAIFVLTDILKIDFNVTEMSCELKYNPLLNFLLNAKVGYLNGFRYDSSYEALSFFFSFYWNL